MQLKEFSLISPQVELGTLLKALETAIPTEAIEQAIAQTRSNEERLRALPSHLVICRRNSHELVVKSIDENGAEKFG